MLSPEFFDLFGFWGFFFIFFVSAWSLKTKRPVPKSATILFLLIATLGLIIDGTIVYLTFLK